MSHEMLVVAKAMHKLLCIKSVAEWNRLWQKLQRCTTSPCHLDKVSDNCLTTFWWLMLQMANQNATTVGSEVDDIKLHVDFPTIVNSASWSHSNLYFDRSTDWKQFDNCWKQHISTIIEKSQHSALSTKFKSHFLFSCTLMHQVFT